MATPARLKTIVYRGGLVRFRIPAQWTEEYEPQGGGTFHEAGPEAGILRLNVLTFEADEPRHMQSPLEFLSVFAKSEQPNAGVILRTDGNASISYWKFHQEDEALAIRYWQVANAVPPRHMRMAVFSYTMLESQKDEPRFVSEVQMIDDEVDACIFAKQLGI